MKRTGFRKLTYKEALAKKQATKGHRIAQVKSKPSKVTRKRKKKTDRQKAEEKLWELCKAIIRKKYQNFDGTWTCYTSGARLINPQDVHTGHGKPKGALKLRYQYDLRNLRPQSFNANINLGGMSDIFIAKLEREEEGLQFLQEACVKIDGRWEIRHDTPTISGTDALIFLNEKIREYEDKLQEYGRI